MKREEIFAHMSGLLEKTFTSIANFLEQECAKGYLRLDNGLEKQPSQSIVFYVGHRQFLLRGTIVIATQQIRFETYEVQLNMEAYPAQKLIHVAELDMVMEMSELLKFHEDKFVKPDFVGYRGAEILLKEVSPSDYINQVTLYAERIEK